MMKRIEDRSRRLAILALVVCGSLLACNHLPVDQRAFQRAERYNTATAYERFAESYPASPMAAEARKRVVERKKQEALGLYEAVKDARKASTLDRFIREHPGTEAATLAKLRIAEIDYHDLATQNPFKPFRPSNSTWEGYLREYAFGDYIPVPEDPELRETYYKKLHPLILQALEKNATFPAWLGYLLTYPDGLYFDEATEKVEAYLTENAGSWEGHTMLQGYFAVFEQRLKRPCPNRSSLEKTFQRELAEAAKEQNTIEEYERYLKAFAESPYREEIRIAKGHLEFSEALLRDDRTRLESLLAAYENTDHPTAKADVERTHKRIQQLDFQAALKENAPAALYTFKSMYEKSDYANLIPAADEHLEKLRKARLREIKDSKDPGVFASFLNEFPDAPERAQVEAMREEAEYNVAVKKGRKAIEGFLARYPDSKFKNRALDSVEKIVFEEASVAAKSGPSTATLAAYLKNYPRGAFRGDAEQLITKINEHHTDYMGRYTTALQSGDYADFGKWIGTEGDNYYVAARGQQDLVVLKRELTVRQLISDVTTTPTPSGQRPVFSSVDALVEERSRAVAAIENGSDNGTGFLFTRDGLLLTNARLVRGVASGRVTAALRSKSHEAKAVRVAGEEGPDAAVLQIPSDAEPIPLANPAGLRNGDTVTCLSSRNAKVISSPGTFVALKSAGPVEWLVIKSKRMPVDLGGVILNRRAQAVGLLVRFEQVSPAVREDVKEYVYAVSVRSVVDLMKDAIMNFAE